MGGAPMKRLPHVMILASAGSGKTYALTNRFIALLAAGAAPDRIVALTFTRKAAGEFFDGILRKLAEAAAHPAAARRLAGAIERPELGAADFRRMLRAVADTLHRLRLGTLDSFFARIARAFPFELGLAGDFEVLQPAAAQRERRRVLQRLFARDGDRAETRRDFLEAFKRATFGAEEKQLGPRLDAFLDAHHERYLEAPDGALWGDAARIWPEGQPWLREVKPAATLAALRRWAESAPMEDKQRVRWLAFHAALETWSPGAPLPRALEYIVGKALPAWDELGGSAVGLTIERRKQTLDAAGCAVLRDAVCLVAGGELRRRLEVTRGIHAVLAGYDELHDALVRRAGRLTFADVERLLRPPVARSLSRAAGGGDRLFLDYRLDAEIDHWLLDEFQDTSRGQWSVLRNLIDEVVQDAEGRRSFFCVGDVKQAIFAWRAGDPRLMGEIHEHYNRGQDGPIVTQPLDRSWRSGPAVIDMVNAVFGSEALGDLFPGRAAAEWKRQWRDHTTAFPGRAGQAALLHAADAAGRKKLTLDLIRELRPLEKGLTCAVLVQRNVEAAELADYLRREGGVPAIAESDLRVCADNPAGAAMLALFQAAAHPGDRLAWEHVGMTPLGAALTAEGVATPGGLAARVLAQVQDGGFERTAEHWFARIEPALAPENRFARERARQFAAAAALFDATGSRAVDEFAVFMESHVVREPESAAVVRVMTVHKAKGLGFDVVIVPELEGTRLDEPRSGLAVQTDAAHAVQWVLDRPTALFARHDAVLRRHLAEAEQDACHESLSLLYVALTRAKRALFVVTEPVAGSSSRNFPKLLAAALGEEARTVRVGSLELTGAWSAGEPGWHRDLPAPPSEKRREEIAPVTASPAPRRAARRPAGDGWDKFDAAAKFDLGGDAAREFGAAVHRLLAQVEWCAPDEVEARARAWVEAGVSPDAIEQVVGVLRAPALADLWRAPADGQGGEVWRERAFEVIFGGEWVSGVIDRVQVLRDAAGRPHRAFVWDFKTEAFSSGSSAAERAERHAPQLRLYRRVVARLTGLPIEAVRAEVVFTAIAERRRVDD
ncbi:MAG: DNA helicase UvrD [Opitutus sp.]|nr:DNA helicase UvrD [Opitutus sp.]